MLNPLQIVTINGEERELLYTLSLYKILQERRQTVVVGKDATWSDVTTAMLKLIYAAYLNAIQVRQIDDAKYNPARLAFMDFVIWSETHPNEFGEQLKLCFKFITGKDLDVDIEKKKIVEKTPQQRKTSIWMRIGMRFKSFLLGK